MCITEAVVVYCTASKSVAVAYILRVSTCPIGSNLEAFINVKVFIFVLQVVQ